MIIDITPPQLAIPKISVVIPMFNAEKYVAACLESLLIQTLGDFEVIVVDDCSTDNSRAIVESYRERFNGRLKISGLMKNSGGGSLPRNKGLQFARGEYIFFADADDLLIPTALAELYTHAKNFDADVVYCEKFFTADANLQNVHTMNFQVNIFVDEPTLEPAEISERVKRIMDGFFSVTPWSKLVRRDLLIEHEIIFPQIVREDDVWTWNLLFHAKKFLRVPNVVYIWRKGENSFTRTKRSAAQKINFWLNPVILGTKILDDTMERVEFFRQNPSYRHTLLSFFMDISFSKMFEFSLELQPFEVYDVLRQKFSAQLGGQDVLICALCTALNTHQKISAANQQKVSRAIAAANKRIAELEAQLNSR